MNYEEALRIVRTSKTIYHAGISGYVIFGDNPTAEEIEAVNFLVENNGYEVRTNKSIF